MKKLVVLLFVGLGLFLGSEVAVANGSAQKAIIQFNAAKQQLINSPDFFFRAVKFYHHRIADGARFTVKISDPRAHIPVQHMTMNKTQYLRGFLHEGQRLKNYQQNYQLKSLQEMQTAQGLIYIAEETIFEQASITPGSLMVQTAVGERFFSSHTSCRSMYQIVQGQAMQLGSECVTSSAFPKAL